MRCPKCHYISFGSAPRCRNCGYEFSLSEEAPPIDLPIQGGDEPIGPFGDLPLSVTAVAAETHVRPPVGREPLPAEAAATAEPGPAARAAVSRFDLPLFTSDDAPLVTPPAVPRAPLSVRRPAPVLAKPKPEPSSPIEAPQLDLEDDEPVPQGLRPVIMSRRDPLPVQVREADPVAATTTAPVFRRLVAGVIDLAILTAINAAVLYFTTRVLGLQFASAWVLPKIPLAAFLLLLNGGYFVLFTAAGGQTIGKMIAGIRVVMYTGDDHTARVGFGAAVVRAAAYFASLLPAGLGFVPILISPDGRTVHDRLADTRVVKA
jgi:uncharacterized RDD family membrane protein YckC